MDGDEWRAKFEAELARTLAYYGCEAMTGMPPDVLAEWVRKNIEALSSAVDLTSDIRKMEDQE